MKKKTRFVLLGLLREEPLTGYEIKKIIDGRMSFFWQESYGQIYPELNALLEESCINEVEPSVKSQSGREKISYTITDKGRLELKQWMEAENEKDSIRSEFLLKMFLSTDGNQIEMKHHLETFYEQSIKQLEVFKQFESQLSNNKAHENHKQILEVLSLGIKQQELYSLWSQNVLKTLKSI